MPHRVGPQHSDNLQKLIFDEFLPGHSLRPLGIRLPRIVRALPTELNEPRLAANLADRFYELANGQCLHLEFQTRRATEGDLERFLHYDVLARLRDHRIIHSVVLYGGRGVRTAPDRLAAGSLQYRVTNIYLGRIDGGAVLEALEAKVAAGRALGSGDQLLLALSGLMGHRRETLVGSVRRAAALVTAVANRQAKDLCAIALATLAAEVATPEECDRIIQEVSQMTGVSRLQERLEARGQARGKAEGKAEAILLTLRKHFGPESVSGPVAQRIQTTTDLPTLDRWLELALDALSVVGFEHEAFGAGGQ